MNTTQIALLCICGAVFLVIAVIAAVGNHYSLNGIPTSPLATDSTVQRALPQKEKLLEPISRYRICPTCGAAERSFRAWTG